MIRYLFYFLIFGIFISLTRANFYKNCGDLKICFGIPENENCVANKNCTVVSSIQKLENSLVIDLKSTDANLSYIALGFSTDNLMGDDFVLECLRQNNKFQFFASKTGFENRLRIAKRYGEKVCNFSSILLGYS